MPFEIQMHFKWIKNQIIIYKQTFTRFNSNIWFLIWLNPFIFQMAFIGFGDCTLQLLIDEYKQVKSFLFQSGVWSRNSHSFTLCFHSIFLHYFPLIHSSLPFIKLPSPSLLPIVQIMANPPCIVCQSTYKSIDCHSYRHFRCWPFSHIH